MNERRGILRGVKRAWSEGGPLLVVSRVARRAAEGLQGAAEVLEIAGATRAVRRFQPATLDAAIEFAEHFWYGGLSIRPMQIESEIRSFLELLASDPPQTILEIGTGRGGTLFLLAHAAREDALLVSIDAPTDTRFGGRPSYRRRARLYPSLGRSRQRIVFLAANSHSSETLARLEGILGGEALDLLFIDGDHTREGVEADFRMYSPLVRSGGLVAFHDIVPGPTEAVGAVPAFWRQFRSSERIEFVEDWSQGSCGIGVVRL